MKKFTKDNIIQLIFLISFNIIEICSIIFTDSKPYITNIGILFLENVILYLFLSLFKNPKTKGFVGLIMLILQVILCSGMIYLFESNGTYFEWSMINQRNDAFGTIERVILNKWHLIICICVLLVYIISWIIILKKLFSNNGYVNLSKEDKKLAKVRAKKLNRHNKKAKIWGGVKSALLLLYVAIMAVIPVVDGYNISKTSYTQKLYKSGNSYQQYGITGNTIYQLVSGNISNSVNISDIKKVDDFVFGDGSSEYKLQKSKYHGVSKGNNLVYILVESFEWYAWLNDWYDQSTLKKLYPNLYSFMENSLILSNFYAREKTDTSEMLSLIGSNPTGKYINYDFPVNTYPQAIPNLFRNSVEDNGNTIKHVKSFHQNNGDFYNRNTLHKSFGFDELVDINDMKSFGVVNTCDGDDGNVGERTLDSATFDKMKDEMFPAVASNEQFFSYILTFSMHGFYGERNNLKNGYNGENYYQTMDDANVYPKGKGEKSDYLRNYAAAVMDFDRAVGIMMKTLEDKNLLDNTTIVMFADHNTYYNNLAYYAKDIEQHFNSELYHIPCMIYDTKLLNKLEENGQERQIRKFTTTSDLLPTILDLFDIDGWKNLYFGSSVFIEDAESIIYSRAYGIFVTNKLICYSVNRLLYKYDNFTNDDKEDFINRAKIHLKKLEYLDKIYYSNYFKTHNYKTN